MESDKSFLSPKFRTFLKINALINSEYRSPRSLLITILRSAMELSQAKSASLLRVRPEDRNLYFEVAVGQGTEKLSRYTLKPGQGLAGWVVQHRKSVYTNDVVNDERFDPKISREIQLDTQTLLAVPMFLHKKCIGVIEVLNKEPGFTQEDLQWMEIFANQAALAILNSEYFVRMQNEILSLNKELRSSDSNVRSFMGNSAETKKLLEVVQRIAPTDGTVLLLGESGVGKELIAEQLHQQSNRRNQPFIRVNCAALPEHLLESELFGHVKGSFTHAYKDRKGRFLSADKGTIFLDEIGEMSLHLQVKLLRVLQSQTFEPVGSDTSLQVNVRVIAASNRPLEIMKDNGEFRSDLYYRLSVLPIHVPPLRDRKEDISVIADFFLKQYRIKLQKYHVTGFSESCKKYMHTYSWPGNIRELQNFIQRGIIMSKTALIKPEDMFGVPTGGAQQSIDGSLQEALKEYKRYFIERILQQQGGNQTKAAKVLKVQRTYLARLIRDLEIVVKK